LKVGIKKSPLGGGGLGVQEGNQIQKGRGKTVPVDSGMHTSHFNGEKDQK